MTSKCIYIYKHIYTNYDRQVIETEAISTDVLVFVFYRYSVHSVSNK